MGGEAKTWNLSEQAALQKHCEKPLSEGRVRVIPPGDVEICYHRGELTEARSERQGEGGGWFHGRRAPTTGKKRGKHGARSGPSGWTATAKRRLTRSLSLGGESRAADAEQASDERGFN